MNNSGDDINDSKVEDHSWGWYLRSLKGKQLDRTSDAYQKWYKKHGDTKRRNARKRLEALAKAPLPNRKKIFSKKHDGFN